MRSLVDCRLPFQVGCYDAGSRMALCAALNEQNLIGVSNSWCWRAGNQGQGRSHDPSSIPGDQHVQVPYCAAGEPATPTGRWYSLINAQVGSLIVVKVTPFTKWFVSKPISQKEAV